MSTDTRTLDATTLAHLQGWVGKTETLTDDITAAPVRALSATLDRDDPAPMPGTALPPLWHWLYFLPQHRQSEIGPDGHAKRGGFLPPVPLPRRMWAGGRLQWFQDNPLRVGDAVQRISRIASVTHKAGRTGDLVFVLVKHEVHNAQGLALTEEHDIVYRGLAPADAPAVKPQPAPTDESFSREIVPDDVLLFRYSALTFNGHRIHYDRRYVTEVEGY
ncbi:MAG: FAS1-like dehydratase domain-containing protein, partial [Polaromonas sp.]